MMAGVGLGIESLQRATPIVSGFLLGYVAVLPLIGRLADLAAAAAGAAGLPRRVRGRLGPHRDGRRAAGAGVRPGAAGRRRGRPRAGDARPGRRPLAAGSPRHPARGRRRGAGARQRARAAAGGGGAGRGGLARDLLAQRAARAAAGRGGRWPRVPVPAAVPHGAGDGHAPLRCWRSSPRPSACSPCWRPSAWSPASPPASRSSRWSARQRVATPIGVVTLVLLVALAAVTARRWGPVLRRGRRPGALLVAVALGCLVLDLRLRRPRAGGRRAVGPGAAAGGCARRRAATSGTPGRPPQPLVPRGVVRGRAGSCAGGEPARRGRAGGRRRRGARPRPAHASRQRRPRRPSSSSASWCRCRSVRSSVACCCGGAHRAWWRRRPWAWRRAGLAVMATWGDRLAVDAGRRPSCWSRSAWASAWPSPPSTPPRSPTRRRPHTASPARWSWWRRMVGMVVGLALLTAVGLHRFYQAVAALPDPADARALWVPGWCRCRPSSPAPPSRQPSRRCVALAGSGSDLSDDSDPGAGSGRPRTHSRGVRRAGTTALRQRPQAAEHPRRHDDLGVAGAAPASTTVATCSGLIGLPCTRRTRATPTGWRRCGGEPGLMLSSSGVSTNAGQTAVTLTPERGRPPGAAPARGRPRRAW